MNKVIFKNGVEHEITSARNISKNIIKLFGENIPQNTSGFNIIPSYNPSPLSFANYKTVYKVENDGVTFSNNGSVYEYKTVVAVNWNDSDDYDGIRPESVVVSVSNGTITEQITLGASNNWKKEYSDFVVAKAYSVDAEGIQGYEQSISGTTITFTHEADIPTPTPEPSELELRVQALEEDINAIDEAIGGEIQ